MSAKQITGHDLVAFVKPPAPPSRSVVAITRPKTMLIPDDKKEEVNEAFNYLLNQLMAICSAWKQAWTGDTNLHVVKQNWSAALISAGIVSKQQIDTGLRTCRNEGSPFVPTIKQFIDWCQPSAENLGLPSVDEAYKQAFAVAHPAASFKHCHQAAYHAACEVGFYVMTNYSEKTSRERFAKAYQETIKKVWRGEALRDLPDSDSKKTFVKSSPEVGNKALADIRAKFGSKRVGASQ